VILAFLRMEKLRMPWGNNQSNPLTNYQHGCRMELSPDTASDDNTEHHMRN